jgi:hypothetical protein
MKFKSYLSLAFLLCAFFAKAQVGIGTTSPYSTLDVRSSNQATPANTDGMLVPKVDAFPLTNPTATQHGMLVFLTTVSGTNQPGFYYWNNPTTSWKAVGSTLTNDWSILGNAATTPGTNFLGTTDDKDIVFKRNNVKAGFIGDPTYNASFQYNNANTSFGANSLLNPIITTGATQEGVRNSAFGSNTMPGLTIARRNVAIGDSAMFSVTSGSENTAVGVGSLYANLIGAANTAIGRNALTSATAGNNTGVGFAALRQNSAGTTNTAIGSQAGYSNTGSGSVFIGNDAGYSETGSNKLYISNSNANAVNALVYGEFDNKIARVNGQIQVNDPTTTGYKFPTARGTNKQILETDGAGNVSWATPNNSLSIVRAHITANQALTTGGSGWQKINFNTTVFDTNAEFDTANSRFIATRAGYYQINAGYHTDYQNNQNFYAIGVRKNGTVYYQETSSNHYVAAAVNRTINCIIYLGVGEYVEIFAQNQQAGVNIDSYFGKTYFEISQIR